MKRIDYLDVHPEHINTLAAWHHLQWGHLYKDWTLNVAQAELVDHATRRTLPTTLVLLEGNVLLGSVSIVLEDAPELSHYGSPWLASLYVQPRLRGQGCGIRLVKAAVACAAAQGVVRLLLFTPNHVAFYRRLGWRVIEHTSLHGVGVDVMEIAPQNTICS